MHTKEIKSARFVRSMYVPAGEQVENPLYDSKCILWFSYTHTNTYPLARNNVRRQGRGSSFINSFEFVFRLAMINDEHAIKCISTRNIIVIIMGNTESGIPASNYCDVPCAAAQKVKSRRVEYNQIWHKGLPV